MQEKYTSKQTSHVMWSNSKRAIPYLIQFITRTRLKPILLIIIDSLHVWSSHQQSTSLTEWRRCPASHVDYFVSVRARAGYHVYTFVFRQWQVGCCRPPRCIILFFYIYYLIFIFLDWPLPACLYFVKK